MAPTKRSGRANSKKAAPSSAALSTALQGDGSSSNSSFDVSTPLFEVDTVGSSKVRHQLLANQQPAQARLRKGQSFNKQLKSDEILAQRSSVPALQSRVVANSDNSRKRKLAQVDRKTKDKLKRIAGRDGQGQGLWGVKSSNDRPEMITEAVKQAGTFDAWAQNDKSALATETEGDQDASMQQVLNAHKQKKVKVPPTLHAHQLLGKAEGPKSIVLPHPGMSYNPDYTEHQALLSETLDKFETLEARDERGQAVKDAMDDVRKAALGKDVWELYEDEVGSGEDDGDEDHDEDHDDDDTDEVGGAVAGSLPKKQPRRKTQKQRNAKVRLREEQQELARRRSARQRIASVAAAPTIAAALKQAEQMSLEDKALALKIQKARLAKQGLTRFRSGPSRVPDQQPTFQLGEELSENLRTLKPEGNLWRDWVGSNMRRGRVPVERANESKKGGRQGRGHDKHHKMREVEKYSYKHWKG
ncbi:hypothetical protein OIO90_004145 [Microbotryomycetes sp. JL221]|nr:hypothetical protein OIO90_004145 [Microbotryomycetes sp. JL221]